MLLIILIYLHSRIPFVKTFTLTLSIKWKSLALSNVKISVLEMYPNDYTILVDFFYLIKKVKIIFLA